MAADDNGSGIEADDTPPLIVKAQYIKDLSFEIPGAPEIFRRLNAEPEIEVEINVQPDDLGDGEFEVVLLVEVRATIDDETAFVAELKYAGLFELNSSIPRGIYRLDPAGRMPADPVSLRAQHHRVGDLGERHAAAHAAADRFQRHRPGPDAPGRRHRLSASGFSTGPPPSTSLRAGPSIRRWRACSE